MKGMQRDLRVGTFAILVSACMLLCVLSPAIICWNDEGSDVDASDNKFVYYALGDSMVNGFGMADYYPDGGSNFTDYVEEDDGVTDFNPLGLLLDIPNSYPGLLKAYLESKHGLDVNDNYMLAMSGMRSAELRALLYTDFNDNTYLDFERDDLGGYMDLVEDAIAQLEKHGYTEPDIYDMRDYFTKSLKDADLITYNFHYDFGYTLSDVMASFVSFEDTRELPFDLYLAPDQIERMETYTAFVMDKIIELIIGSDTTGDEKIIELANSIAKAVVFVAVSYCSNYDANISWMLDNTHARIVYVDAYNTFGNKMIDYNGMQIPLGQIYGLLVEAVNGYVKHLSPHAGKVTTIDVYDCPELYCDEFASGGDIDIDTKRAIVNASEIWKLDEYKNITYDQIHTIYDGYDVNGNLTKLFGHIFGADVFDFNTFTDGNFDEKMDELEAEVKVAYGLIKNGATVEFDDASGVCTIEGDSTIDFDSGELAFLWMDLFLFNSEALMSHPSHDGHQYLFDRIVNSKDTTYCNGGTTQYISPNFVDDLTSSQVRIMDLVEILGGTPSDGFIDFGKGSASDLKKRIQMNDVIVMEADAGNSQFLVSQAFNRILVNILGPSDPLPFDLKYDRFDFLPDELVPYLNNLKDNIGPIVEEMLASTDFAQFAEHVPDIVDVLLYTYMGALVSMMEAVDLVKDLNSDATILFVGAFNPLQGCQFSINMFGTKIELDIGTYLDMLVSVVNAMYIEFCDAYDNVIYVDVSGMQSSIHDEVLVNIPAILEIIEDVGPDSKFRPDNDFIKDRVQAVLNQLTPIDPIDPVDPVDPDNPDNPDNPDKGGSDNTMLIVGGGIGAAVVVAAGLVIFFRMRS